MRTLHNFDEMCLWLMVYCMIGIIGLMSWAYHIQTTEFLAIKAQAELILSDPTLCPAVETYRGQPDYHGLGVQFTCWEI
jgi:hypothetical protein